MLPPLALAPESGAAALDMCASPGSKTGLLAQLVGAQGFVLANEPSANRLATLRRNLQSLNLFNCATTSYPGEKLSLPSAPGSFFPSPADGEEAGWDRILLDPPCSGWGTAERHPKVMKLWKGDKIKPLVNIQRDLLRRAAQLLQPGGRLAYSTCTTNSAENEDQVAWACETLGLRAEAFADPSGAGGREALVSNLQIAGGEGEGQGFFVAMFGKDEEASEAPLPASGEHEQQEAWWAGYRERLISRELLSGACLDADLLPPGEAAVFGDSLIFMSAGAAGLLPAGVSWRGFPLGKFSGGAARLSPRLRVLMRGARDCPALDVEEPEIIRRLLSGNSLDLKVPGREAGLYFQGLPLGVLRVRSNRAVWSEG